MNKRKRSANPETIFETEKRLKQQAKEISENHKDIKPIKYLLKK